MKKPRTTIRKTSLLFALELLDDLVKRTIGPTYMDSTTQRTVAEAIARAKNRSKPKYITPRQDQMPLPGVEKP